MSGREILTGVRMSPAIPKSAEDGEKKADRSKSASKPGWDEKGWHMAKTVALQETTVSDGKNTRISTGRDKSHQTMQRSASAGTEMRMQGRMSVCRIPPSALPPVMCGLGWQQGNRRSYISRGPGTPCGRSKQDLVFIPGGNLGTTFRLPVKQVCTPAAQYRFPMRNACEVSNDQPSTHAPGVQTNILTVGGIRRIFQ